jgi:hypothetical protein
MTMISRRVLLPTLLSLCSSSARAFTSVNLGRRAAIHSSLYDASTSEIGSMRAGELKKELESYGISTTSFLEKSELVGALEKARSEGLKPKSEVKSEPKSEEKKKKKRRDDSDEPSTKSESSSTAGTDVRPREERLKEERENCKQMKAGELKKELEERGISTRSFFEKSEFVQAVAEARVDGVEKKKEKDESYAEYADVEVLTDNNSGPRSKQSAQSKPQTGGGGMGGMGGLEGMMSGMGGMGGIADMLKNMGGGGGASAGANPMGGMGGTGDMMGKAQEMMKNPKVMEIMMKAQKNPKVMKAMQECMGNPAAFAKYQNDPEIGELMRELQKVM